MSNDRFKVEYVEYNKNKKFTILVVTENIMRDFIDIQQALREDDIRFTSETSKCFGIVYTIDLDSIEISLMKYDRHNYLDGYRFDAIFGIDEVIAMGHYRVHHSPYTGELMLYIRQLLDRQNHGCKITLSTKNPLMKDPFTDTVMDYVGNKKEDDYE